MQMLMHDAMLMQDAMLMHDAKIALMLVMLNSAGEGASVACMCAGVVDEALLRAKARGNSGTRC